jgi:hypothetical protein
MGLTGETEPMGEKQYSAAVVDEWVWNMGGMTLTVETEVLGKNLVPVRNKNLAWTGRGSTPCLRGEMAMGSRLSLGTAHI